MSWKCDEDNCVRFMNKECQTKREDGVCDQPDMYLEYGDLIDRTYERMREMRYV